MGRPSPLSPHLCWLRNFAPSSSPHPTSLTLLTSERCNKQKNQQYIGNMEGCLQHGQVWSLQSHSSCFSSFFSSNLYFYPLLPSPPLFIFSDLTTQIEGVLRIMMMKTDCPTVEGIYQHISSFLPLFSFIYSHQHSLLSRAHQQQHRHS